MCFRRGCCYFCDVHAGLSFFLDGRVLSNNSIVLLSDIGEGSSALYCLTDGELCCSTEAGGNRGQWTLPDGSSSDSNLEFVKGFSSLLLNRRSSAVGPTGVYRCLIPDAVNIFRTLYIGIYDIPSTGILYRFLTSLFLCNGYIYLHSTVKGPWIRHMPLYLLPAFFCAMGTLTQ